MKITIEGQAGAERDKVAAQQKKRIEELAGKWLAPLHLDKWDVKFVLRYDAEEYLDDVKVAMSVHCQWQYMVAEVYVNLEEIIPLSDKELEEAFLHEMGHVFLNEMREWSKKNVRHEERVATHLARAFLAVSKMRED